MPIDGPETGAATAVIAATKSGIARKKKCVLVIAKNFIGWFPPFIRNMRAIRATSILILAIAAFWSLRLAWADRLSRSVQLAGRERAARWAPWSAAVRERLAEKRDETGGDPVPDLEAVAALEPANARGFERLGQRAEFAGKRELAERSLVHAAELSRLYQPRYLLAQYYFRRGDAAGWDLWSRQAFDAAPATWCR